MNTEILELELSEARKKLNDARMTAVACAERGAKAEAERDDLARQLGEIKAAVNAWEHLPIDPSLGLVDSIKAADAAFLRNCEEADAAMEVTCGDLLAARKAASQTRQETLREAAKALGAEESFEAMEATCGPSGVTPEGLAGAFRITLGLTEPHTKIVGVADPFAGIMDGPEMMPLGDFEGDQ